MPFFHAADLTTDRVDANSTRTVVAHGGSLLYAHIVFEHAAAPDEEIPLHHHVHEQITYVLKGSFRFRIEDAEGDRTEVVTAGDGLYMPSNSEHGCIPLEDGGELLDCFTPQRLDYLHED